MKNNLRIYLERKYKNTGKYKKIKWYVLLYFEREGKSLKWNDNIQSIVNKKESGICPFCGSERTDYTFEKITSNMGYCVIWCNDCKSALHISRTSIAEGYPLGKEIPKDLKYKQY